MQTPSVQNQIIPQTAPVNKPSASDNSITPFRQMLSREIAERHDADDAPEVPQSNGSPPPTHSDGNASKAKDAKAADDKTSDDDKSADAATDARAQTPAAMLALVAHLNPAKPSAATPAADAKETAQAKDAEDAKKTALTALQLVDAANGKGRAKSDATALSAASERAANTARAAANSGEQPDAKVAVKSATGLAAKAEQAINGAASAAPAKTDFTAELKESLANAATAAQAPQSIPPAALQMTQAAAVPATDKLMPPVGSPAWDQTLGQKVVWMVAGGQQSASLTLNPPDLGPLQVVLHVNNSTAHASFTAAQPEVRQALETAMPKLREMLGDAGIQLGQATVNSGTANQQQTSDQQFSRSTSNVGRIDGGDSGTLLRAGKVQPAISGRGLVDTFV